MKLHEKHTIKNQIILLFLNFFLCSQFFVLFKLQKKKLNQFTNSFYINQCFNLNILIFKLESQTNCYCNITLV